MGALPILRFEPICKPAVWGGRELARLFGRTLPGDGPVGESWEVADLPGDQSVVADGPLAGATLEALCRDRRGELLGAAALRDGRFPLLLKLIDARRTLSVQVHPDEGACRRLGGGARPKTEAWYVIERDPGAALFVGLREGVDRARLERSLENGDVETCLERLPVEPGDFVFLPAGTVHAIGAGVVLAEVQQASDTTFRLFDWNRLGLDGRPRRLHVAEALESVDFSRPGAPRGRAQASGRPGVACDAFSMELVREEDGAVELSSTGPVALMGLRGSGRRAVTTAAGERDIAAGETLLVPASGSGRVGISAGATEILVIKTSI